MALTGHILEFGKHSDFPQQTDYSLECEFAFSGPDLNWFASYWYPRIPSMLIYRCLRCQLLY